MKNTPKLLLLILWLTVVHVTMASSSISSTYFTPQHDLINIRKLPKIFWQHESDLDFCRTFLCDERFEKIYAYQLAYLREKMLFITSHNLYRHAPPPELVVVGGEAPAHMQELVHLRAREYTWNLAVRPYDERRPYAPPPSHMLSITPDHIVRHPVDAQLLEYYSMQDDALLPRESIDEIAALLQHHRYTGCHFFPDETSQTLLWYQCPEGKNPSASAISIKSVSQKIAIFEEALQSSSEDELLVALIRALQDYYLTIPAMKDKNALRFSLNYLVKDEKPSEATSALQQSAISIEYKTPALDQLYLISGDAYRIWHVIEQHIAEHLSEDVEDIELQHSAPSPQQAYAFISSMLYSRSAAARTHFSMIRSLPLYEKHVPIMLEELNSLHGSSKISLSSEDIFFVVSYLYNQLSWETRFKFHHSFSDFYRGKDPNYLINYIDFVDLEERGYGLDQSTTGSEEDHSIAISDYIHSMSLLFALDPLGYFKDGLMMLSRYLREQRKPKRELTPPEEALLQGAQLPQLFMRQRRAHALDMLDPDLFFVLYLLESFKKDQLYHLDDPMDQPMPPAFFTHSEEALELVDQIHQLGVMEHFDEEILNVVHGFGESKSYALLSRNNLLLLTGLLYDYLPTGLVAQIEVALFDYFDSFPLLQRADIDETEFFMQSHMGLHPRVVLPTALRRRIHGILQRIASLDSGGDDISETLKIISSLISMHKDYMHLSKESLIRQGYYLYTFDLRKDEELMSLIDYVGGDPNLIIDDLLERITSPHKLQQCLEVLISEESSAHKNPLPPDLDDQGYYSHCWRALHLKRLLQRNAHLSAQQS